MKFLERLRASPVFTQMRARTEFEPSYSVLLRHWWQRDIATGWCEHRWRSHQRPYRRRIDAVACNVVFEFSSEPDALAFRLADKHSFRPVHSAAAQ